MCFASLVTICCNKDQAIKAWYHPRIWWGRCLWHTLRCFKLIIRSIRSCTICTSWSRSVVIIEWLTWCKLSLLIFFNKHIIWSRKNQRLVTPAISVLLKSLHLLTMISAWMTNSLQLRSRMELHSVSVFSNYRWTLARLIWLQTHMTSPGAKVKPHILYSKIRPTIVVQASEASQIWITAI